jgi:hypothetical protein
VSEQDRAAAVAFCAGRDVACPSCGYNLRDSVDGVCSECGRALVLRGTDDRRPRRAMFWLLFVWSAVTGGGPLGLSVAYWAVYRAYPGYGLVTTIIELANLAAFAYGVAGIVTLISTRRRPILPSRLWTRIGWVVLLGMSVQYVVAAFMMGPRLFGWSLGLPF